MKHDLKSEQGQVLGLVTVALIAMLAMSALVMDVGFAWYAKRQLQASVDAAALAGAQAFPDNAQATQLAKDYLTKNNPTAGGITINSPSIDIGYLQNSRLHAAANKITVTETGSIPTTFAKVVGLDKFDFTVSSTACQPCGTKPFDVMVVLDRTGSMCSPTDGDGCVDLNAAKEGIWELLQGMDAKLDQIGMVAFPPIERQSQGACGTVAGSDSHSSVSTYNNNYDDPRYWFLADQLQRGYQNPDGSVNKSSPLYLHTTKGSANAGCVKSAGGTSYSQALQAAIDELNSTRHNTSAQKVIIFLTDGSANEGPTWNCSNFGGVSPCSSPAWNGDQNLKPCTAANQVAFSAKQQGILIYTIGYALNSSNVTDQYCERGIWHDGSGRVVLAPPDTSKPEVAHYGGNGCYSPNSTYRNKWAYFDPSSNKWIYDDPLKANPHAARDACVEGGASPVTPTATLRAIATDPSKAYDANSSNLVDVFAKIAADIESGTSRLANPSS